MTAHKIRAIRNIRWMAVERSAPRNEKWLQPTENMIRDVAADTPRIGLMCLIRDESRDYNI